MPLFDANRPTPGIVRQHVAATAAAAELAGEVGRVEGLHISSFRPKKAKRVYPPGSFSPTKGFYPRHLSRKGKRSNS